MIEFTKQETRDYLTKYHQINTTPSLYGREGLF
jgi:hypothetical protein